MPKLSNMLHLHRPVRNFLASLIGIPLLLLLLLRRRCRRLIIQVAVRPDLHRSMADTDISRKDSHLVGVAEKFRDLLERDAAGLGEREIDPDRAEAGDDDEDLTTVKKKEN